MDPKTKIEWAEFGLKVVALLASGIWAFWLLIVLRKRELARAELQKKEAEIRDLELKAKRQAAVSVEIQPTVIPHPSGEGHLILANVELTNRGDRNTWISWQNEPAPFAMRAVENIGDSGPQYGEPKLFRVMQVRDPGSEAISHVVRAGATEKLVFLLRAASPGLYLLSFRGAADKQERTEAEALGAVLPVAWTCNKYVLVPEAEVNLPPE